MKIVDPQQDRWHARAEPPAAEAGAPQPAAPVAPAPWQLLTLAQWHALRGGAPGLAAAAAPLGLLLPNTAELEPLAADLPRLALVALQFPRWTDGRAYSQARLLRRRFGFGGELRATGEVLVDMLPLLHRTGFDAALLRPEQDPAAARPALGWPCGHYQGDARGTPPRFARQEARA
jgi:uncharacterized protein (DUF934 family)